MSEAGLLVKMLHQLLREMEIVTAQGAGYYTCVPFAQRYNKLLSEGQRIRGDWGIMKTFEPLPTNDPKDPADKSKVLLEIRIEISQLIAVLDTQEEPAES